VVLGEPNVSAPIAALLSLAVQLNLLLAVFNMLPIPPLDGGNVLSGLLPASLATQFDRIRPYGFILIYALVLTNGYTYLVIQPYRFLRSLLP
jgi:Zn-dependent protease